MLGYVKTQLAIDLNCSVEGFSADGIVFCEAADNPGRRPYPREKNHVDILTMGKGIVVSATSDLLPGLRNELDGCDAYAVFSQPFVCGQSLYFLPDPADLPALEPPPGVAITLTEKKDISALYGLEGFCCALQYDEKHARPDMLAAVARKGDKVIGVAGASCDCVKLWQIGVDVLDAHREAGVGAVLVNRLATEIMRRGYVPYYGAASCNIASQRTAYRAGFAIAWMCMYRGRFDGFMTAPVS